MSLSFVNIRKVLREVLKIEGEVPREMLKTEGEVPREMLKTSGFALTFQHLPQDLMNVNEWKIMFDPYTTGCEVRHKGNCSASLSKTHDAKQLYWVIEVPSTIAFKAKLCIILSI